ARMLDALEREIRDVEQALDVRLELDEGAEFLEARDLAAVPRARSVLLLRGAPGILDERLAAEPDLAALVDLRYLDRKAIARAEQLRKRLAGVVTRFRDRKSTRLNSSHVKISYAV